MPSNAQLPVVQGAVLVARDGSVVRWLTDLDAYVVVLSNQEGTDPHHCVTELLATVLN